MSSYEIFTRQLSHYSDGQANKPPGPFPPAALVAAFSYPAYAQLKCGDRTEVLNHLATNYHEAPIAVGLVTNGEVIEVLASPDGKTWTIIIAMPDGTSCLIAAGQGWKTVQQRGLNK